MRAVYTSKPMPWQMGHTAYHHIGDDAPAPGVPVVPAPAPPPGFSITTMVRELTLLQKAMIVAAAFHGYRRNQSILWALGWTLAAGFAPLVTTGVAVAQGFGKKKGS